MSLDLFLNRLTTYSIRTKEDEEHALKEMLQELILFSLSESHFFEHAVFNGGTSLRIHYHMPRFSEDLDFMLASPDPQFSWDNYAEGIVATCSQFGVEPEIMNRHEVGNAIQPMFVKDASISKLLSLAFHHDPRKKLKIKLEIDTNPPAGSYSENRFLNFPVACTIRVQDLPSGFAMKNHALLCRPYTKGRDWYDFYWYIKGKTALNFELLKNALNQQGPWAGQIDATFTKTRFLELLQAKIETLDWQAVKRDVAPFLTAVERKSLQVWDHTFFMAQIENLESFI